MPSSRDRLVLVGRNLDWKSKVKLHQVPRGTDHDAGERPGEVALQVRQHQVVVVAATQTSAMVEFSTVLGAPGREEIVGAGGEPHAAHVAGVHLEGLDRPAAPHVVQNTRGVLRY